jgi:osmotically-inducible protein OsmY
LYSGAALFALAAHAQVTAAPVDNSAINERDRSNHTLTPENQSQSKSDVALAAAVRRAVIAQSGLSTDGQNIKIITMNNAVTLRGPVKDSAERTTIDKIARAAAGQANVDNQLETR